MTGFKSGASGDDPFSDPVSSSDEPTASVEREHEQPLEAVTATDDEVESTSHTGLPWIYKRDSITDGRAKTVQLHLQQSTLDRQREARSEVEELLGESVKKADLREAALLVGLSQLDAVADELREWGYDVS